MIRTMFYNVQNQITPEFEQVKLEFIIFLNSFSLTFKAFSDVGNLWFWVCWMVAQFCVNARLKTPIGKPQDTFMAFETVIKNFANEIVSGKTRSSPGKILSSSTPLLTWFQVRLLGDFVEALEKQIYNAYQGCGIGMYPVPKVFSF